MRIRRIFFWLHLSAGSTAGLVILVLSFTGVLLAYQSQIIAWAERDQRFVESRADAARLRLEIILARVRQAESATLTNVAWHPEPNSTVELGFGRERTLFANPYTGSVIGEGAPGARRFFRNVGEWHRWLAASISGRAITRPIVDAANLLFFFLVGSGFYLWWPKSWSAPVIGAITWFRRGLTGKARDFNWHNTIGFWCCVPLFVIVLCSVVMSYQWADNLVYRIAGSPIPGAQGVIRISIEGRNSQVVAVTEGLDALAMRAEFKTTDWRSISLRLPTAKEHAAVFTIDAGNGGQPALRSTLTLDRKTAAELTWEPHSSLSRGRRWRSWMRFAHTGEVFGILGQTVATIASLGAVFLVYTGLAMALRRLFNSLATRKSRSTAPIAAPLETKRY